MFWGLFICLLEKMDFHEVDDFDPRRIFQILEVIWWPITTLCWFHCQLADVSRYVLCWVVSSFEPTLLTSLMTTVLCVCGDHSVKTMQATLQQRSTVLQQIAKKLYGDLCDTTAGMQADAAADRPGALVERGHWRRARALRPVSHQRPQTVGRERLKSTVVWLRRSNVAGDVTSLMSQTVACSIVASRLDCCNAMFYGAPTGRKLWLIAASSEQLGQSCLQCWICQEVEGLTHRRHSWPPTEDQKQLGAHVNPPTDSIDWYSDPRLLTVLNHVLCMSLLVFLQFTNTWHISPYCVRFSVEFDSSCAVYVHCVS